ncbi:MAG: hypothetical protein FWD73_16635 [Polyangiaceae bacterium]|nr:hypothetical protein [Polyangiaceae bacterium]
MQHYTIETGHCRESPRSEVSDAVITALTPLLVSGTHKLPAPRGYQMRVTVDGQQLAATALTPSGAPLVTAVVAVDDAGLSAVLRATGAHPAIPLRAPALLVTIHPTIALDAGASSWLGDWERCVAWAWIDRVKAKNA